MKFAFRKHAPGLFSWLIRQWTRSEYSHVEAGFGVTMISAVEGIGVRSVCIAEDFDRTKWDVIEVPLSAKEDSDAYLFAMSELGCKYDWKGIIFCQVFHWGRQHADHWFCSEFCTAVFQATGRAVGVKPYQQSPGAFARLLKGYGYAIC